MKALLVAAGIAAACLVWADDATPDAGSPAPPPAVAPTPLKPPPDLPAPAQEVVRLSQSTVGEGVVVDYISTVTSPYTLSADQIVYLSDLGISTKVIQALLARQGAVPPGPPPAPEAPQTYTPAPLAPAAPPPQDPNGTVSVVSFPPPTAPGPADFGATALPPGDLEEADYSPFYDALSPYGNWTDTPEYGWGWQPTASMVDSDWMPYCDGGNWVWTDLGWYWNSTYSWGWGPFHYGRWALTGHGWVWLPDRHWGPAWVAWRGGARYLGWAPLPPSAGWRPGIGFTHLGRPVAGGAVESGLGATSFTYVEWGRFLDPHPRSVALSRNQVDVAHYQTRVLVDGHTPVGVAGGNRNNVVFNNGPGLAKVQQYNSRPIPTVTLRAAAAPAVNTAAGLRSSGAANVAPVYQPRIAPWPTTAVREPPTPFPAATQAQRPYLNPNAPSLAPARNANVAGPFYRPGAVATPNLQGGYRPAPVNGLTRPLERPEATYQGGQTLRPGQNPSEPNGGVVYRPGSPAPGAGGAVRYENYPQTGGQPGAVGAAIAEPVGGMAYHPTYNPPRGYAPPVPGGGRGGYGGGGYAPPSRPAPPQNGNGNGRR